MSDGLSWFPLWTLWVLVPWIGLHFYYDFRVGDEMRRSRKAGDTRPIGPIGFYGYIEIQKEIQRRYQNGDALARLVTYYDRAVMAGVIVLVGYRIFFR